MNKVEIQIPEFLKGKLIKDLQENEVICPICNGTGLAIDDNRYGIQGEYSRIPFPYTHQSIGFCQHCYNGINHKCPHCGKILNRGSYKCDCKEYEKEQLEKENIKYNKSIEKAQRIKFTDYEGLFLINDVAIDKDSFEEWLYYKIQEGEDYPISVLGTTKEQVLSLDIRQIIYDACEDGYEDMSDNLDYDGIEEIQEMIDKWIKKQGDYNYIYYDSYKVIVLLDDLIKEIKEQIEKEDK